MPLNLVDLGAAGVPNSGDTIRDGGEKINANFEYLDTRMDNIETNVESSLEDAQAAASDAEAAALDAQEAAALANAYQGEWSSATGAATEGSSYLHNEFIWMLLYDVANITATEPSNANSDWLLVAGGTAAAYDVTTSATDTSAGGNGQPRVIRRGDFGLGAEPSSFTGSALEISNLEQALPTGFYSVNNNATNTPENWVGGIKGGVITVPEGGSRDRQSLIAIQGASKRTAWFRFQDEDGEGIYSWEEILHTGNTGSIDPTTSTANTTSFNHTSTGAVQSMRSAGAQVGSITVTGSATSYNTSSDYRLKEDWQSIENASGRLLSLRPVNFKWKSSEDRADGFLAHELQEVIPEAVTGEKDEVELIISTDEEGNEIETESPKHQAIDQSKIVPLLTAALQDALKRIEALESKEE